MRINRWCQAILVFGLALDAVAAKSSIGATSRPASPPDTPTQITLHGIPFVLIPGGLTYKTRERQDKIPPAQVWVDSFYIARYELSTGELVDYLKQRRDRGAPLPKLDYESCVIVSDDGRRIEPWAGKRTLAASGLSWEAAREMAQEFGFRLPTEAEWERAARGDTLRRYPWGDTPPTDGKHAAFGRSSSKSKDGHPCARIDPVTANPEGASPFGVLNMAGNVAEFVEDVFDPAYLSRLANGTRNPKPPGNSGRRLYKGGRWGSPAWELAISEQTDIDPKETFRSWGVRFAVSVDAARAMLNKN